MISPFNQAWLNNFPTALIMRVKQWFDDLCLQVNTALTSIASMPSINTQIVVTGSRSFGLSYHNTTGRPCLSVITVYPGLEEGSGDGINVYQMLMVIDFWDTSS